VRRAYKFRLYPNDNQLRELATMLETHRRLWNACLEQRVSAYKTDKRSVKYVEQSAWFKEQRKVNPWFERLNFSSAQDTMRRLEKAYAAFFRRVKAGDNPGFPRFKTSDRYDSFTFPSYGDGVRINGKLRVQHVGLIRIKQHRSLEGVVKTVTLKHEAGKWYAVFSCDLGDVLVEPSQNPPVGIDVGIESFYTSTDGHHEPNPKYLKEALPELRLAGRAVSRKKRGGQNRKKAVKALRVLHTRIANLRHQHRHEVSNKLCRSYGLIAVESLNIKNMMGNRRLSRAIADAAWGGFLATLQYKAASAGVVVVEVNPRGTSQRCSACGEVVRKSLGQRQHVCSCGLSVHRDINAARNILALVRTEPAKPNDDAGRRVSRSRRLQATE
jgi:putative transposase